jgi:hypothetical protein
VTVSPSDSGNIEICNKYIPSSYPDTKNYLWEDLSDDPPRKIGYTIVFKALPSPGYKFDHWEGFITGVSPISYHELGKSDDGETATAVFVRFDDNGNSTRFNEYGR